VISTEDFLWFVDEAVDGMVAIVTELGDDLANQAPDLPGANSPYALLTHCLGVMAWWSGEMVAGRRVERDRDAEFVATGPVAELAARARRVRDSFAADLAAFDPDAPPTRRLEGEDAELPLAKRQGASLVHVYEELQQHRGQMEVTRDILRAPWARLRPPG
jgi:hypothetical protein